MQSRHLFVHVALQLLGGKGRTISTGIFIFFFYLAIFWYFRSTSKSVLIHSDWIKSAAHQFINQFLYGVVATRDHRVQVFAAFVLQCDMLVCWPNQLALV